MKRLITVWMIAVLVTGCKDEEKERYMLNMAQENDSLIDIIQTKNVELEEITGSMNAIETNLAAIRRNEVMIDSLKDEGQIKQEYKINSMIQEIDSYMEQNRQQIERLEGQLRSSKNRISGLERLVALQKQAVEEKEKQIEELLGTISFLREELQNTIVKKDAEIVQKQTELTRVIEENEIEKNTAFYRCGSRDELTQDGIVQRQGGVLGAGKTLKLANKFNQNAFKKVSITDIQEIDVGAVDKKNVITAHPSDSYYFVKTDGRTYLKILDQQRFWSLSKYLVIETDG